MNRQITRLFTVIVALFALLVVFTSRWTVFEATSLENQSIDGERVNQRPLLEQQQIPRGIIRAEDGTRLAINKQTGSGQTKVYSRVYPTGPLFAHAVGYSFIQAGSAGLERFYNDELSGSKDEFGTLLDQILGQRKEGQDLRTTLNPAAQKVALQGLAGRNGSVVALDPTTGRVLVMANVPSYDPNRVVDDIRLKRTGGSGRFDRATQARYPPGSTFKVVTAAAALDTGRYTPDSLISGKNNKVISGVPLQNSHGEDFPTITLTDALTHSVNTVFGEVAEKLGKRTMYRYMRMFGFNQKPPIDLPSDELTASGVYNDKGKLLDDHDAVDIGRVGIGQERLQVTPLQMAMVAATVANGGVLMKPHVGDRFIQPDGRLASTVPDEQVARVMKPGTAAALTTMMGKVVEEGTGTAAQLQGIDVAGKTGTAEVANGTSNQAWFIGFAPKNDPKVAVAVTIERTQEQGGTVAAPIARDVIRALIGSKASG
jgi:penicillin-binding protein A